jgi:hypothetical protein
MKELYLRGGGKTLHVVICLEACCRKGWGAGGVTPPSLTTTLFSSCSVDISFEDDVTVILLLGVSFMFEFYE